MLETVFGGMAAWQIAALIVSAILIGINKTGIPGLGLIPVIILMLTFDPGLSTGIQLVMLCTADVAAVAWYRRHGNFKLILRMLPAALVGLFFGSLTIRMIDKDSLMLLTGVVILMLSGVNLLNQYLRKAPEKVPSNIFVSGGAGLLAGFSTHVANAAGPVMALYLMALRLPKQEYMGTASWFFLLMNWIKLPVFISEGRVTLKALYVDLWMLPFLAIGAVLGILIVNRVSKKFFDLLILVLSSGAAVYIILRSLF